jgi:hypothetical protein
MTIEAEHRECPTLRISFNQVVELHRQIEERIAVVMKSGDRSLLASVERSRFRLEARLLELEALSKLIAEDLLI